MATAMAARIRAGLEVLAVPVAQATEPWAAPDKTVTRWTRITSR